MKIFYLLFFVFLSFDLSASKVDTISVYSNVMRKEIKAVVITPRNYKKSKERFPVVYLLHGYSGNYAQWIKAAPQLQQKADELKMILVCPDGGFNSWYFDSPLDTTVKYETFISKELISYIDLNYKTIADNKHRAITGLSMGGHGGLYLSIKHKDVFSAAGSICGGVDIRPFPKNWDLKKQLGDSSCCLQNWEDNTVVNLVDQLKNKDLRLIIDCGLGDFFLNVNRNLHQKLMNLKIDHDYIERPGAHNTAYWGSSIDYQLLFFRKWFDE
ncbi:MAG: alpha/beta hydrolase family protein [Lacibacter sp.]